MNSEMIIYALEYVSASEATISSYVPDFTTFPCSIMYMRSQFRIVVSL